MHVGIICEHSLERGGESRRGGESGRGGAERYLGALIARLQARGHKVTICARTGPHARPVRAFPAALRPRRYAREFLPYLRDAGAERVLATVPVPGIDFYQPHTGVFAEAIPPHLEPLPAPLRFVRRYNPTRVAHFAMMRHFEEATSKSATVLALSPMVADHVRRHYPDARCELFRPGVDLQRFRPVERDRGDPVLLFVAANFRLKGLRTAIGALEQLSGHRLLVVGGDAPIRAPRVEYAGAVDDIASMYARADILVHPTYYDTASLVVLEALASGIPAITTKRDGNADLAIEAGGVALDGPGDPDALARAVRTVLAGADAGKARAVAERFGQDAMLDLVVFA